MISNFILNFTQTSLKLFKSLNLIYTTMSKDAEEVEYEFESENEQESEMESEVEPQQAEPAKPPRKKYAPTKGDADKRRAQCILNLQKARLAKVEKAKARKLAESKVQQYQIQNSESEDSEDEAPRKPKRKSSKAIDIPSRKSKSSKEESRLDRIEAFMEEIAQAKAKPKAKVVRNTIVQVPAYGQPQPTDPRISQLTRKLFHDI